MTRKTAQKCSEGNIGTSEQCRSSAPPARTRAYAFTSYSEKEPVITDDMEYLCFSPEICPSTLKHHFQGYFYLKNGKSMKAATRVFNDYNISVQVAKGTASENRVYCGFADYTKDEKFKPKNPEFKEFGTLPSQGARNDLIALRDRIVNGTSVSEIVMESPIMYHQYGRTLEKIEDIVLQRKWRTEMTIGTWLVGPTGVGKSHVAFNGFHPDTHYSVEFKDNGWWDGYKGQDTVILNDFRGGQMAYEDLLCLIDKWPKRVPRRGREPVPFISKHVIITCPLTPEEVYPNRNGRDNICQLLRRIDVIHL